MADESKDILLRLILKIDDNKLPPLDTRAAEESLEKLRQMARQVRDEVGGAGGGGGGGSASASSGGGGRNSIPGVSFPSGSTPASDGYTPRSAPTSPSYPVYDLDRSDARIRRGLSGFGASLSGAAHGAMALSAGVALWDLAGRQEDPWQSYATRWAAGLDMGLGGAHLARFGLRGAARLGEAALGISEYGAAVSASTGLAPGLGAMFGRLAAPLAGAGLTLGGTAIAAGVAYLGYQGYQLYDAISEQGRQKEIGRDLDWRRASLAESRFRDFSDRYGALSRASGRFGREDAGDLGLYSAGAFSYSQFMHESSQRLTALQDLRGKLGSGYREALASGNVDYAKREAAAKLAVEQQILSVQRDQARAAETLLQRHTEQLRLAEQRKTAELEIARAQAAGIGRLGPREQARLMQLERRAAAGGMTFELAREIESLTGQQRRYDENGKLVAIGRQTAYLDQRGQDFIDRNPLHREFDVDSRTTPEQRRLEGEISGSRKAQEVTRDRIKETLVKINDLEQKIGNREDQVLSEFLRVQRTLETRLTALDQKIDNFKRDSHAGWPRRTAG